MGASQFLQTKMTPMTGDPAQQRMMMFMPLMFMVFFLWMPSGLVLYWLVSNVWTIGQQYVTNRLIGSPSKPVVGTTAATKRVKRRRTFNDDTGSPGRAAHFCRRRGAGHGPRRNVEIETLEDGSIRVDIQGDGGEVLLRRKGEGLDALQHIVNTAFRRDLDSQRIVIDSLGFRRGKDVELNR